MSPLRIIRLGGRLAQALTYDFCPWANRWVAWIKHPVGCLALAALAPLLFALFLKPIAWVVFAAIMLTLALGLVWPGVAIWGLRCAVGFDHSRVTEGETVRATLTITNRWPWPLWGLTLQQGFLRPDAAHPLVTSDAPAPREFFGDQVTAVALARIPGWSTNTYHWPFTPACRGEYPFEIPKISTGFPFGLWRARRSAQIEGRLLVWPRTFFVNSLLDTDEVRPSDDRFSDCLVGECGDMMGTRPFREGDPLRRVHWAQTARHDRLVVCERQAAVISCVEVVLDTEAGVHSGAGPNSSLEWAIRITSSLCRAWHAENARVWCRLGPQRADLLNGGVVPPGAAGLRRLLDAMARLPVSGHDFLGQTPSFPDRCQTGDWAGLQIIVTTEAGVAAHPELRSLAIDQRFIVLKNAAFKLDAAGASDCSPEPISVHRKSSFIIDDAHDVTGQFLRKWRSLCYEG